MLTEFPGRVKEDIWNRPTCMDGSDSFRKRQRARRDFKKEHQREEGQGTTDVVSTDKIDEALELGDPPLPDPDDNRTQD